MNSWGKRTNRIVGISGIAILFLGITVALPYFFHAPDVIWWHFPLFAWGILGGGTLLFVIVGFLVKCLEKGWSESE